MDGRPLHPGGDGRLKRRYGVDVAGILPRYRCAGKGEEEQILGGKAYVIGFDWNRANESGPKVRYLGSAAWAVELVKRGSSGWSRELAGGRHRAQAEAGTVAGASGSARPGDAGARS
ncbi:MAG: hypothetical protein ABGY09_04625 [Euryarchaeota archaeon]